jgi:hypothetical protein
MFRCVLCCVVLCCAATALVQGSLSAAELTARARGLETFAQRVINTAAFQTPELFAFFELHNPARQVTSGTLMPRG